MKINTNKLVNFEIIYLIVLLIPFQPLLNEKIFLITILSISALTMMLLIFKNRNLPITYFNIGYIILIIFGLVSVFYTKDVISTKVILMKIIPYYFSCLIVCWYILSNYRYSYARIIKFLKVFVMSTLFICIMAVLSDIKNISIYTRIGKSLFNNQYTMFTYDLMISICITIWLYFEEEKRIKKFIWGVITVFIYIIIISTAVRKAMLIPIVFLVSYIFIISKSKKKLFRGFIKIILIFTFIIIAYSLLMKNEYFASTAGRRIQSFMNGVQNNSGADNSFNERKALISAGWECFRMYPFWGYGFGAFRDYAEKIIGLRLYAHNNFIELLASSGIVGFSIYYGIITFILIKLISYFKINRSKILIFGIAFIISLLVNDLAAVTYLSLPYMMILSIISCVFKYKVLEHK